MVANSLGVERDLGREAEGLKWGADVIHQGRLANGFKNSLMPLERV